MLSFISTIVVITGLLWTIFYALKGFGEVLAVGGILSVLIFIILLGGIWTFGLEVFALICTLFLIGVVYYARNQ